MREQQTASHRRRSLGCLPCFHGRGQPQGPAPVRVGGGRREAAAQPAPALAGRRRRRRLGGRLLRLRARHLLAAEVQRQARGLSGYRLGQRQLTVSPGKRQQHAAAAQGRLPGGYAASAPPPQPHQPRTCAAAPLRARCNGCGSSSSWCRAERPLRYEAARPSSASRTRPSSRLTHCAQTGCGRAGGRAPSEELRALSTPLSTW